MFGEVNENNQPGVSMPQAVVYFIMILNVVLQIAIYWFTKSFVEIYKWGVTGNILLPGLLLFIIIPFVIGIYTFDLFRMQMRFNRCMGGLILFLLYKPAYPLYRQSLLERNYVPGLIYFFGDGIFSAVLVVRFLLLLVQHYGF